MRGLHSPTTQAKSDIGCQQCHKMHSPYIDRRRLYIFSRDTAYVVCDSKGISRPFQSALHSPGGLPSQGVCATDFHIGSYLVRGSISCSHGTPCSSWELPRLYCCVRKTGASYSSSNLLLEALLWKMIIVALVSRNRRFNRCLHRALRNLPSVQEMQHLDVVEA